MKTIAVFDEAGRLASFADVASNKKLAGNERTFAEEKPDVPDGMELVGPDYRIEEKRVVAVYELQPVDELAPAHLLARIRALEGK